jgi:hypothetical protein
MTHFDLVQLPYILQMLRAAFVGVVWLLIAREMAHTGRTGLGRRNMVVVAGVLTMFDAWAAFIAFAAVGVSAGTEPLVARADVLTVIRAGFTASALCGITAQALLLGSMARVERE